MAMSSVRSLKRREFLVRSSAALAAGLTGTLGRKGLFAVQDAAEAAAAEVGRLPRRKLGPSGREVSLIIGSGDLASAPAEAAILCGVNYWHKANAWVRSGVPAAILKDREAHYCQVTVDRVGGNQEAGRIDEESHYRFVKDVLDRTGLRYFDDMQFHFGYHSRAELRAERGFVRAFERLKKEGLVKHLCLSQHGYAGNARVPGGESAAEILTAVIEDGLHEHAQIMYSYGQDPETDALLALARQKDFGTIAMKTARGLGRMTGDKDFMSSLPTGTVPHHALARWLTTETDLTAAVIRVRNLEEFVQTFSGAGKRPRDGDARALAMITAEADRTACRLCTACQPHCPRGIPIADVLRFERYALDDHDLARARGLYRDLGRPADVCDGCGACVPHCPQGLDIPAKLAATHSLLAP
jgi:predicted aldo/keto reductase-like oxidoreductase